MPVRIYPCPADPDGCWWRQVLGETPDEAELMRINNLIAIHLLMHHPGQVQAKLDQVKRMEQLLAPLGAASPLL